MNYTLKEIAAICGGSIINGSSTNKKISSIAWDSRQLLTDPNTLFVAIKGPNHNAHNFLEEIEQKGISVFLVSSPDFKMPANSKASFLLVENSLKALQKLAKHHRSQFILPVIGITGSNGKTTIKEWLGELLAPYISVCKNPKSYNSKLGVPLSLLQLNENHQLGIFETGISKPGEMNLLADLIQPEFSIFTNLGAAHDEGFTSRTDKLEEKMHLLKNSSTIFLLENDDSIQTAILEACGDKKIIKSGHAKDAFLRTIALTKEQEQTRFKFYFKDTEQELLLPFIDDASVNNVLYCILVYYYIRQSEPATKICEELQSGLDNLRALAMRLEIIDGSYNSSIINDTYTNDLDSLEVALQHLIRHHSEGQRILILSDLMQINVNEKKSTYSLIGNKIKAAQIDLFIGIGKDIQLLKQELIDAKISVEFYETKQAFKDNFDLKRIEHSSILIKGARKFEFEDLVDFIAEKNHRTYLEINLNSLRENLSVYRSKLSKKCKLLAMVKAEAYGGGDHEIAKILEQEHIDYLGVAYVDEGIKLRKAGIRQAIFVLNAGEHEFEQCIRYHLEPEIHTIDQFKALAKSTASKLRPIQFHLKIETGMNRLGFRLTELDDFINSYKNTDKLRLKSVFSHLAASEAEAEKVFTRNQFKTFNEACDLIHKGIDHSFDRHILNTSGISKYPEMHLDMVRLGIGLFGIDGDQKTQEQLQLVFKLKARVTAVHKVPAKETIGYGRMGSLDKDSNIATISIGYADGLLRKAGNRAFKVQINNRFYPIVGNVCMDMCMIDLGQEHSVKPNDEVVIFEDAQSLNALSKALETIPYEVLTNISQRVRRKYIQD
ncbi:MAG: bifunctional UDP-N-acetylmuramoyl-tripeptide:D-alanyl-D-alanine ligase/alanine racemase [Saprospiraceae bacterium]|nr:bifunctional UDP-N-acetylmuramoyl-tripeptide:D-alanyl-D-alanine ligase/alanine racemase [Saprospiraceae bacterium]